LHDGLLLYTQGGLVARALFTIPGFDVSAVHTIITQATPHRLPVIALDPYLVEFYDRVNNFWLHNATGKLESVTVLSTGGGHRDMHVRDGHTLLDEVEDSLCLILTQTNICF